MHDLVGTLGVGVWGRMFFGGWAYRYDAGRHWKFLIPDDVQLTRDSIMS